MTKDELIDKLASLPDEIYLAEMAILGYQNELTKTKEVLTLKEAELYTEGVIDGKNSEIRTAQLKQLTIPERNNIATAENELNLARINFNQLQNTFVACRAIASMLKGVE